MLVKNEIKLFHDKLLSWSKPESVRGEINNIVDTMEIRYEALGVVLLISPWNYPFLLALQPLVAAVIPTPYLFFINTY